MGSGRCNGAVEDIGAGQKLAQLGQVPDWRVQPLGEFRPRAFFQGKGLLVAQVGLGPFNGGAQNVVGEVGRPRQICGQIKQRLGLGRSAQVNLGGSNGHGGRIDCQHKRYTAGPKSINLSAEVRRFKDTIPGAPRALISQFSTFPDFIFSHPFLGPNPASHPDPIRGQKCLGIISNQLTTDVTDTIWIKFKRRMLGFPISSFLHFIFSAPALVPNPASHPDPIRGQKCLGTIRTN